MINKSIIITALARDCADNLSANIARIEELRSHFIKSNVVVLENDSKDKTPLILSAWAKYSVGVSCISEPIPNDRIINVHAKNPKFESKSLKRISKMAYLRNRLLELSEEVGDFDYYLLLDIDVYSFSVDGILKAITEAPSDWGGLFANGCLQHSHNGGSSDLPMQYDVYAFFKKDENFMDIGLDYLTTMDQFHRSRFMSDNINSHEYFPCLSAFGGIGIYRYNLIKELTYSAIVPTCWIADNICLCEHLSVNKEIWNKGYRCYIARNMKVSYGYYNKTGLQGFLYRLNPALFLRLCRLLKPFWGR